MHEKPKAPSPILVVSSDTIRRQLAYVILKRRGANVSHVESLAEGLRVLEADRHEAVLLDLPSIPMDGRAGPARLLEGLGSAKLLLVDAAVEGRERLRAAAAAVIAPSLDEDELVGALKLLVNQPPVTKE